MALPSNPSRSQILAEFGTNTKSNNVSNGSLKDAYNHIFETFNFSRDAFGGYGQPTTLIGPTINVDTDSATIQGTITPNGLDTEYRFEWGAGDFSNVESWNTLSAASGSTQVSLSITGLTSGTSYQYRLVVYNNFNSNYADWKASSTETFSTENNPPDTVNVNANLCTTDGSCVVTANWNNNSTVDPIEVQFENTGDNTTHTVTASAGSTSAQSNAIYSDGDSVRARVRYTSGDNTNWSAWSSTSTVIVTQ